MPMPLLAALAVLVATPAVAVDPADLAPPTPTETTTVCKNGRVWDPETETCTAPTDASLDDRQLLGAARELAHAGRYGDAERVLDAVADQCAGAVLTYRGFLARKRGDWAAADTWYGAALAVDPDDLLARSYRGLGMLARGDHSGARAELSRIRARGGRNTWAEAALAIALSGSGPPGY